MTKMELAQALSDKVPGMTISQAISATEGVIGVISDALVAGDTLTLRRRQSNRRPRTSQC